MEPAAAQILLGLVQDGLTSGLTVIVRVEVSTHGAVPTVYVTLCVPEEGSKEVPLTPVPLQVPPAVPVIKLFKLIEPAVAQIGLGLVHDGFTSGTTVMVWFEV